MSVGDNQNLHSLAQDAEETSNPKFQPPGKLQTSIFEVAAVGVSHVSAGEGSRVFEIRDLRFPTIIGVPSHSNAATYPLLPVTQRLVSVSCRLAISVFQRK